MNDVKQYHLLLPLAELEHIIHGGGPKEVEAEVLFTPSDDGREAHPDVPAKVIVRCAKMHHRLEVRLLDFVLTPAQEAKKAERDAWEAERDAQVQKRDAERIAAASQPADAHTVTGLGEAGRGQPLPNYAAGYDEPLNPFVPQVMEPVTGLDRETIDKHTVPLTATQRALLASHKVVPMTPEQSEAAESSDPTP